MIFLYQFCMSSFFRSFICTTNVRNAIKHRDYIGSIFTTRTFIFGYGGGCGVGCDKVHWFTLGFLKPVSVGTRIRKISTNKLKAWVNRYLPYPIRQRYNNKKPYFLYPMSTIFILVRPEVSIVTEMTIAIVLRLRKPSTYVLLHMCPF